MAQIFLLFLFIIIIFFCLFVSSRAASAAYGGSQARGLIRVTAYATATAMQGPSLQSTPQRTTMPDP